MTTLLLVEDNEMNRDMLSRRLKRRNYQVLIAENGGVAVTIALRDKPDLILMDMEIPVKDGWTATREIKQQLNVPIVALTAHALSGDKEKALAAGCDDYATKPVEFEQLISIIEKQLSRHHS